MSKSILVNILAGFSGDGIKKAQRDLQGLGDTVSKVSSNALKLGASFAMTKVWQGFSAAVGEATTQARNLERNLAAVDTVFGNLSPQIEAFSKSAVNLGLNQGEAAKASVFLGSVLKQSGFSIEETAMQTEKLVTLGSDLALTYGYDVQEALLGMTALFRGEYDPIEKFGVAMKQSEINSELAARGFDNLEGSARRFAEQQIRLDFLYERSGDAQGAFQRQAGTLAVEQEKLQATFENLMATAGAPLIRVFAALAQEAQPLIQTVAPQLISLFEGVAKEALSLARNNEDLVKNVVNVATGLAEIGKIAASVASFLLQNVSAVKALLVAVISFKAAAAAFNVVTAAVTVYKHATKTATEATLALDATMKRTVIGLVASAIAIGASYLLDWAMSASQAADATDELGEAVTSNVDRIADLEAGLTGLDRNIFSGLMGAFGGVDTQLQDTQRQIEALEAVMEKTAREGAGSIGDEIGESAGELSRFGNIAKGFFAEFKEDARAAVDAVDPLQTIWDEIAAAQRKSQVTEQLESLGFNAGAIAQILKGEDWEAIFGVISRYARIAAIDIANIGGSAQYAAAVAKGEAQAELDAMLERINSANPVEIKVGGGGGAKKEAKNYVQDYLDGLALEIKQLAATNDLKKLGFTQGQIDQILNSEGWEVIFKKIMNGTDKFIEKLQVEYGASAAGIEEWVTATQQRVAEAEKASDKIWAAYEKELSAWERIRDAAYEYRDAVIELGKFKLDVSLEQQLGKFEAAIVSRFTNIREKLAEGLADKKITEASSKTLLEYVAKEEAALRAIELKRDELANRYELSKALIAEYRSALTASLSLNSLFQQIGNRTKEVTVNEVTKGVAVLGSSLKEFGVTVTRSYQKTVDEVTDKSGALVDNFRKMAEKAKAFAENLRTLRKMGLDPQLFSQLVQAGVEAGGETAQALIDGGSDSINEINKLYKEIDDVGKSLGEDVAASMYGTGISMSNGLLDGILSKMDEYKKAAQTLADTFATEFNNKVGTAVNTNIPSAPKAPTNVLTAADRDKLDFLMKRRAERTAEWSNIPAHKTEWREKIQTIVGSYETQIDAILAKVTPFAKGGIVTKPVMGLVGEAGPEAIIPLNKANMMGNTYNIYVNANSRAGGKAAGDALISSLSTTVARNGSLLNVVTGS